MQKFTPESIQALCESVQALCECVDSLARDVRAQHIMSDAKLDFLEALSVAVHGDYDEV